MALKGIDIFKLSPKKNCRECGCPTCLSFCMKVAQGAVHPDRCPYFTKEAKAKIAESSEPAMRTITAGDGDTTYALGGETVLFRHEKAFVSPTRYAVCLSSAMSPEEADRKLEEMRRVDYVRIGERMFVEMVEIEDSTACAGDGHTNLQERYAELIQKAAKLKDRVLILTTHNTDLASKAVDYLLSTGNRNFILNGADFNNYAEMNALAVQAHIPLGVFGGNNDELYDTMALLEKLGNRNLLFNAPDTDVQSAFSTTVQFRRAAIKDGNRTCGYPSIVHVNKLAGADAHLEAALLSLFTVKYGSILIADRMTYALANPLYGLRQNIFSDPQKPMRVEPGIYPINGADENSILLTTTDFALTCFLVEGELERSGVPCNLVITDAGGYSVLTSWAAGKLSASSIASFVKENVEPKVKCRTLCIPGKVAVLKKDLEKKLPGWKIFTAPREAIQLGKFLKDMQRENN